MRDDIYLVAAVFVIAHFLGEALGTIIGAIVIILKMLT